MKVRVAVDGSDSSLHAVEHVIGLAKRGLPVSVNLLNVSRLRPTQLEIRKTSPLSLR